MFPFFSFQKNYPSKNNKIARILSITINVVDFMKENLYFNSWKSYASSDKNPQRKPAVLKVDSVTVFWIVAAFLFIPSILTGLISY